MEESKSLPQEIKDFIKENPEYRMRCDENGEIHGGFSFQTNDEMNTYKGCFCHGVPQGIFSKETVVLEEVLYFSKKITIEKYDEEGRQIILSAKDPKNGYVAEATRVGR